MRAAAAGVVCLLLLSLALIAHFVSPRPEVTASVSLQQYLSDDTNRYCEVIPGREFSFPRDHGEHQGFKTEWWYFTGNLQAEEGRRFGYQLTFFRVALSPEATSSGQSAWTSNDLFMGHLALSDPVDDEFYSFERFARRALGLAGVEPNAKRVWLENWKTERLEGPESGWRLEAAEGALQLDLKLLETKPEILQGEGGYSRKGPQSHHASYYVSQTHLESKGTLRLENELFQLSGLSWFDHEWSSQVLAEGLVGWDWFSLHLSDDTELMLFHLRYEDGRLEPTSSGTVVQADGRSEHLALEAFEVEVTDHHRSQRGVNYPSEWNITVASQDLKLKVVPIMANQEMATGVPYWEGAVLVSGTKKGVEISGQGFVELTGYGGQGKKGPI